MEVCAESVWLLIPDLEILRYKTENNKRTLLQLLMIAEEMLGFFFYLAIKQQEKEPACNVAEHELAGLKKSLILKRQGY